MVTWRITPFLTLFSIAFALASGDDRGAKGGGRLVLVTHMTPDVVSGFGRHTRLINERYAERHGYRLIVDVEDYTGGLRDPRWNKVGAPCSLTQPTRNTMLSVVSERRVCRDVRRCVRNLTSSPNDRSMP